MTHLSRRRFGALTVGGMAAPFVTRQPARQPITAAQVLERIKGNIGVEWKAETTDTIKAGDPATAITGIVTTAMATMAVLQQAVKLGANMVVSCEPTFYARSDARTPPARGEAPPDPVYAAKNAFIDTHGLVILRFNEHWRRRQPSPFMTGFGASLGWTKRQVTGDPSRYELPASPLRDLARLIAASLGSRGGIRGIGDPALIPKTAALLPGSTPIGAMLDTLPGVDLVVAGEVREWESVEFARDAVFATQRKGLVLVGRVVSEEGAMRECATWLAGFAPEVKVRHVPVGDPVLEAGMTAGEIVARIKQQLGVPWREQTYRDTFKFGGPETVVTGIATTAFATMEVIERAAAAGLNFIIPHEVTFWNDRDDTAQVERDPLYARKVELMKKHDIAVFRIHDHMHAQRPDFTFVGSARDVGLDSKHETAPGSHRFVIPETTLGALAASVQRHSGARALRVVGDPALKVTRVLLGVGYATPPTAAPDVEVVISGEQQEADGNFDSPAYVLDAMALGVAKGWIMLGHTISEEAGMLEMADWIRGFVTEVPVQLIKAGEPFWVP